MRPARPPLSSRSPPSRRCTRRSTRPSPTLRHALRRRRRNRLGRGARWHDGLRRRADRQSGRFSQDVDLNTGQAFAFTTTTGSATHDYHVRCLPDDFPNWTFTRSGQPSQQWYLIAPALSRSASTPRSSTSTACRSGSTERRLRRSTTELLPGGNIAMARYFGGGFGANSSTAYDIRRLDSSLVKRPTTVGSTTDHHEIQQTAQGVTTSSAPYRPRDHVDLSAYGGPADATIVDGEIQELDASQRLPSSGHGTPRTTSHWTRWGAGGER